MQGTGGGAEGGTDGLIMVGEEGVIFEVGIEMIDGEGDCIRLVELDQGFDEKGKAPGRIGVFLIAMVGGRKGLLGMILSKSAEAVGVIISGLFGVVMDEEAKDASGGGKVMPVHVAAADLKDVVSLLIGKDGCFTSLKDEVGF